MYKSEQLISGFQSSVHYLKKHNVVLHISTVTPFEEENDVATGQFNIVYQGAQKICFEFLDPKDMSLIPNEIDQFDTKKGDGKKPKKLHMPIMVEKQEFELAYIVDDVDNDKTDSFIVVLSRFNG